VVYTRLRTPGGTSVTSTSKEATGRDACTTSYQRCFKESTHSSGCSCKPPPYRVLTLRRKPPTPAASPGEGVDGATAPSENTDDRADGHAADQVAAGGVTANPFTARVFVQANPFMPRVRAGVSTQPFNANTSDTVFLTFRCLTGQEFQLSADASCLAATLVSKVHTKLGLKKSDSIKLTFGTMVLEDGEAKLGAIGIKDGDELNVMVMSEVRVVKHVYRSGGGAPPWRYGHLVSTEEVHLNRSMPLCKQWEVLWPRGDRDAEFHLMTTSVDAECSYCHGKGSGGDSRRDKCENCAGAGRVQGAPKLWFEADKDESCLARDDKRTAGEVFQDRNEVGIVVRLRGMD